MNVLALPADGWVGIAPPIPSIESDCRDNRPVIEDRMPGLGMPLLACRASGRQVADMIDLMWNGRADVMEYPQLMSEAMAEVLAALPVAHPHMRRYVFPSTSEQIGLNWHDLSPIGTARAAAPAAAFILGRLAIRGLTTVGRFGGALAGRYAAGKIFTEGAKRMVRGLMTGENHRIHPLLQMGAVAYLHSRVKTDGGRNCSDQNRCIEFEEGVGSRIETQMSKLFKAGLVFGEEIDANGVVSCDKDFDSYGDSFETWATAVFHMRHEQLNDPFYEIRGVQQYARVAVRKPIKGAVAPGDTLKRDKSTSHPNDIYERYADVVLRGDSDDGDLIIELKSYRAPTTEYDQATKLPIKLTASKFTRKTPLWDSTKPYRINSEGEKVRTETSMHRQVILDMMRSRIALDANGARVREAGDFRWYFQDWGPRMSNDGKKVNERVGVSMGDVVVERRGDKTLYPGPKYIAARLSALGASGSNGSASRKIVGFNLGVPPSLHGSSRAFPGPLYISLHRSQRGGEGTGLNSRFRSFGIFGEGITEDQKKALLKNVFGLDDADALVPAILGETAQWMDTIQEQITALEAAVGENIEDFVRNNVDPELQRRYGDQLERIEDRFVQWQRDLTEATSKVLPETPSEEQTCL